MFRNKSVLLSIVLTISLIASLVYASPRLKNLVTKTSRNEGNTRTAIAVNVAESAWSQVLPASPSRRGALLQTLTGAVGYVCLSPTNTAATECVVATAGARIEAGSSYSDYSEQVLYARVFKGAANVYVYGFDYTDSRDGGYE
jgi:hypothetical protein